MMRHPFVLLFALVPLLAPAQTIYKCIDASGGTVITNTRIDKNCKAVASSPETSLPAPPKARAASAGAPSPAGFPRVGEDAQKARDNDRRHILEQELAGEQRALDQARRELAEQEAARGGGERSAPYRDRVAQHERNLQAIQKELANLR